LYVTLRLLNYHYNPGITVITGNILGVGVEHNFSWPQWTQIKYRFENIHTYMRKCTAYFENVQYILKLYCILWKCANNSPRVDIMLHKLSWSRATSPCPFFSKLYIVGSSENLYYEAIVKLKKYISEIKINLIILEFLIFNYVSIQYSLIGK
jgi:hypothetical protein